METASQSGPEDSHGNAYARNDTFATTETRPTTKPWTDIAFVTSAPA